MDFNSDDDMKVIGGFHRNWRACIPAIKIDGKMVQEMENMLITLFMKSFKVYDSVLTKGTKKK